MSDFGAFVNSIPIITRYWLGGTFMLTLFGKFGIIRSDYFFLIYELVVSKFQIWRPVTSLFFYPLNPSTGFHFLLNCYFLYNYSLRLETGHFDGRPADYLFMLIFNWMVCVVIGMFTNLYYLMDPMVLSVLYVWCQLNRDRIVYFWFGSKFKAMYFPWVLLAFNMIINGGGLYELIGILVGHCYVFFSFYLPQEMGGPSLLKTPSILYNWFPNRNINVRGFGMAPSSGISGTSATANTQGPTRMQARRHDWGRGHTLGGQ